MTLLIQIPLLPGAAIGIVALAISRSRGNRRFGRLTVSRHKAIAPDSRRRAYHECLDEPPARS